MECFYLGRLSGIKAAAWQSTAIDVASSYTWAEIHVTPKNPSARYTSALARRVAQELAQRGWRLDKVMTDIQTHLVSLNPRIERPTRGGLRDRRPPAVVA